ncbi:hypothetical protein [Bacteroides pyogenes]|uniref:hypothetical protein n=1 Tax=Bacteroides pyogenes TaxID=310300 RepID=UPI002A90C2AA|nr:hypothetical protein [Bacteroides pyogenes]MDY5433677.1 hypothetical protein [Bacteroides pyogenes]
MYLDKDSRGIYSLHDISIEELNFLRTILSAYRIPEDPDAELKAFQLLSSLDVQILRIEAGIRLL